MPDPADLLNWHVFAYLAIIVATQALLALVRSARGWLIRRRRRRAGLGRPGMGGEPLVDHAMKLQNVRKAATVEAVLLVLTVFVVPFVMIDTVADPATQEAIAVTFLALVIWVLISATDVAKALLSGTAFRAFAGFRQPFQVGDRVSLQGHTGKVVEIGPFFVRLVTSDDDLVSIPTASLWSSTLTSSNAGERASLTVMAFHLAPFVGDAQLREAKRGLWEAVQRSMYWDFDKPLNIFVAQTPDAIVLTVKAYVALTYNEAHFRSDVTQAFLETAHRADVPLAASLWQRDVAPAWSVDRAQVPTISTPTHQQAA